MLEACLSFTSLLVAVSHHSVLHLCRTENIYIDIEQIHIIVICHITNIIMLNKIITVTSTIMPFNVYSSMSKYLYEVFLTVNVAATLT